MDKMERLMDEFNDLLNRDPDFNYSAGEFDEWLADLCNE